MLQNQDQMTILKGIINNRQLFETQNCKFMKYHHNKTKKSSVLKETTNERLSNVSPSRYGMIIGALSSGCHPKQPPNVSHHYQQKKQQEVKCEYYNSGKQNKGRIINHNHNHGSNFKQQQILLDTTDRLRQKRNSHQYIPYESKYQKATQTLKTNHDVQYAKNSNYESKYIKTVTRTKQQPSKEIYRDPICLKSIKVTKLMSNMQKQPRQSKKQRTAKKQFFKKSTIIPDNSQCNLKCFQKLSVYSIVQNKVSSLVIDESSQFNYDESGNNSRVVDLIEKNPSLKLTKSLHKSPRIMSPTAVIKSPKKTDEQLIAEFQKRINQINIDFQYDSLQCSKKKDEIFVRKQNLNRYLDNQLHLDWKKRAMVINWMIEVLAESGGKRQTLANAVNILDRYLSVTLNIPLDHIQCTAVACLLISSKLEDKSLSASYLCQTTLNKYGHDEILLEQEKILKKLKYQVNTPTLNSWANRLALHWDVYLQNVDLHGFELILNNLNNIKFKNSDEISYYNYRWLCQYVDIAIMDIFTLRYQPRMLALAFIYIVLAMRLNLHSADTIVKVFPNSSQFLLQRSIFNDFFSKFITDSFSHDMQGLFDLLPNIQYGSTFAMLPLKFDLPDAVQLDNSDEQVHYEHFCSYQTKNQHMLSSLYRRNRNII